MNKIKQAYITLLSSKEYLNAVLVLALSLKKVKSKYPLVVAVTEDICDDIIINKLEKINCIIEKIEALQYGEIIQNNWKNNYILNTASKIQIFKLKHYDKLVYLDADFLAQKNIDDLFNFPDGSMLKPDCDFGGLSGLFVFEPKHHHEEKYYPILLRNFEIVDGTILGDLWFHVETSKKHQIPLDLYFYQYYPETECFCSNKKLIHYGQYPIKIWLNPEDEYYDNKYPLAKLYKEYLEEIKKLTL